MAATGAFASLTNTLLSRPRVIYRQPSTAPTSGGSIPINRLPTTPPPQVAGGGMTPPATVYPVNVDPSGGGGAQPVSPLGGSGGGFVPSTGGGTQPTSDTPGTTTGGSTTGAGTGGGGAGTDSQLLALLASAFKPQDISQPYGPIASGPTVAPSAGGGPNPIALLLLGIIAVVGVMWYMNRNKRAA